MKKQLTMMIVLALTTTLLRAQTNRGCATMEYLEQQKTEDPHLLSRMEQIERDIQQWLDANPQQRNQSVITIPVVFHVVWNTSAQNISDAHILDQLDVLNKDFARLNADAVNTPSVFQSLGVNTSIQFCMAQRDPSGNATTGIVRRQTTVTSFSSNNNIKFYSSGGSDAWSRDSYLNIWSGNLSGGLLGYAQFPGGTAATDGVVCLYSSIGGPNVPGTATPYHLGRTATHEVGHWLNLRHIWGDASCGNDYVTDTPTQQTSNGGCPSFPHVTCSNGPNGDMFMNYMDYTTDACMNIFTLGQSDRMNASLNTTRASLLASMGCVPPSGGTTCGTPASLLSSNITTSSATLNWGVVSGAVSYNIRYKATSSSTWTNGTSTSTSFNVSGLSAATSYEFQVQAVCGSTSGSYSSSSTFTTLTSSTCTDTYEPNNSSSAYKIISVNTDINALISSTTDADWFRFTTVSPNTKINVTLTNLPADYDITLYNSRVKKLGTGQNGGTTSESIIRNSNSAATYYVKVNGYNGAYSTSQCYKLRVNASSTAFRLEEDAGIVATEVDAGEILVVPNPTFGPATFEFISESEGLANIRIIDITGRVLHTESLQVTEGPNFYKTDVSNFVTGIHLIMIETGGSLNTGRFIVQ